MTAHGRKYGEKDSHPIPLWNGVFEHYDRIGDALWEFAWCIDRITDERDDVGIVLGGSPVKIPTIVADLKGSRRETVRRHMDTLESENYIRRRRTPYGHVIEVLNSRKFGIWKKEKQQNGFSLSEEKPIHGCQKPIGGWQKPKNDTNKEDSAVTQQYSAAKAASTFWLSVGINPADVTGPFRKTCEDLLSTRNGQSLGEFMGICMDAWEALGNKTQPRVFAKAKARIIAKEREQGGAYRNWRISRGKRNSASASAGLRDGKGPAWGDPFGPQAEF